MPERWLRFCRRLVPEPWRSSSFDPAIADLQRAWLVRRRSRSALGRAAAPWRHRTAIALTALECRRLATRAAVARLVHASIPESRSAMVWSTVSRACRVFVRQPGVASVVVLTLAIGIGANLTIFGIVNQFLLAPLPVPDHQQLVRVTGVTPERDSDVMSFPVYRDLRDGSPRLELAAHAQPSARVGSLEAGELATVEVVTGNYFRVLGLGPLRGRLIEDRDNEIEGSRAVAVISASYWRRHYGRSETVIGQTLIINSTPFEIIGVAPDGFHGTYNARQVEVWAPLMMHAVVRPRGLSIERRGWGWLSTIGRLKPGADLAEAQHDADTVAADINRRFPPRADDANGSQRFAVRTASPMSSDDQQFFGPALGATFAFTLLLLVVTCANLAGVMQARLVNRSREVAIRRSLGAGRGRLAGEWLAESLVLAAAGGVAGVFSAALMNAGLSSLKLPVELVGDLTLTPRIDWRVLTYAAGVSVVTGLLFGCIPAIRAGAAPPMTLLKDDGGTVIGGRTSTRLRRAMVLIQVAVSVTLLVASGLLVSSLRHQGAFNPGFDTSRVGLLQFDLRLQGLPRSEWPAVTDRLLERVRQHAGVRHADVAMTVPLAPGRDRMGFTIPGYVPPTGQTNVSIDFNQVGPEYFKALGVPFVRGGPWTRGGPPSIVINETMARRFWPNANPVGQLVKITGGPDVAIAGVLSDTTIHTPGEPPLPFVYLPAGTEPMASFLVVVGCDRDPEPLLRSLATSTLTIDRRLAPLLRMTFDEGRSALLFPIRVLSGAAVAFAIAAVLLTAVGLYGVVSTMVGQRTREIGVRMALGARSVTVLASVFKDALLVASTGAAAGLAGGYWVAGQLRSWLFGVGQFDVGVYLTVSVITIGLAIVAASLPARRAASIDPVVALRN
jgi:predicted permease